MSRPSRIIGAPAGRWRSDAPRRRNRSSRIAVNDHRHRAPPVANPSMLQLRWVLLHVDLLERNLPPLKVVRRLAYRSSVLRRCKPSPPFSHQQWVRVRPGSDPGLTLRSKVLRLRPDVDLQVLRFQMRDVRECWEIRSTRMRSTFADGSAWPMVAACSFLGSVCMSASVAIIDARSSVTTMTTRRFSLCWSRLPRSFESTSTRTR